VIFVEDLPRPGHVDGAARQLVPGQGRHPVEVRDDHAVLGRGGGEATETPELTVRFAARLLGQPRLLEASAQLRHLGVAVLLLAELALDGPELLTEIVLALLLAQALLGLRGDLPAELAHGELALEEIHEAAELVAHRIHLEDLLARRRVQGHHRGDEIRHAERIGHVVGGHRQLVGQLWGRLHESPEDIEDGAAERVDLRRPRRLVVRDLDPRDQVGVGRDEVGEADALDALHHDAHAAVGHPHELVDHTRGAEVVEVLGLRRLHLRVALGNQGQETVATHDIVHEADGLRLPHREGNHGQGEHHRVPQREHGQRVGNDEVAGWGVGLCGHQRSPSSLGRVTRRRPRS